MMSIKRTDGTMKRIADDAKKNLETAVEALRAARAAIDTLGVFSDPESILAEGAEKSVRALEKLVTSQIDAIEWDATR